MWLKDLDYFLAIVDHKNIGRAAAALGISQPALSKSLRRLESLLKARLFERTPYGVAPTAIAITFADYARAIRREMGHAFDEVASLRGGSAGHIVVGAGPTMLEKILPSATLRLLRERPKVSVRVVAGLNDTLFAGLRRGELDLIFTTLPESASDPEIVQMRLLDDDAAVVAAPNHPLCNRGVLQIHDIINQRWILLGSSVLLRQWLDRAIAAAGFPKLKPTIESDSITYIKEAVSQSDLLAFLAHGTMSSEIRDGRLVTLRVNGLTWRRHMGVSYRRRAVLPSTARRLIEIVQEICAIEIAARSARAAPMSAIQAPGGARASSE